MPYKVETVEKTRQIARENEKKNSKKSRHENPLPTKKQQPKKYEKQP